MAGLLGAIATSAARGFGEAGTMFAKNTIYNDQEELKLKRLQEIEAKKFGKPFVGVIDGKQSFVRINALGEQDVVEGVGVPLKQVPPKGYGADKFGNIFNKDTGERNKGEERGAGQEIGETYFNQETRTWMVVGANGVPKSIRKEGETTDTAYNQRGSLKAVDDALIFRLTGDIDPFGAISLGPEVREQYNDMSSIVGRIERNHPRRFSPPEIAKKVMDAYKSTGRPFSPDLDKDNKAWTSVQDLLNSKTPLKRRTGLITQFAQQSIDSQSKTLGNPINVQAQIKQQLVEGVPKVFVTPNGQQVTLILRNGRVYKK